jgi:hypothetical protein
MPVSTRLYPEDFHNKEKNKENRNKKKLSKNAEPPSVTKDRSYWGVIVTYFLELMRPHVIKLGNNPDVQSVDSCKFLHEDIWGILAEEYNKKDHPPDLGTFLQDDNFYEVARIPADIPSTFDTLTSIKLSQLVSHINFHYRKVVRCQRTLGSHWPISKYIGTLPWLLFYNKTLSKSSIEMKVVLVSGDLPEGVGVSLCRGEHDTDSDGGDTKPRKRKYSPPRKQETESEKSCVAKAMEEVGTVNSFCSCSLFCSPLLCY